jgi:hypothetical protein
MSDIATFNIENLLRYLLLNQLSRSEILSFHSPVSFANVFPQFQNERLVQKCRTVLRVTEVSPEFRTIVGNGRRKNELVEVLLSQFAVPEEGVMIEAVEGESDSFSNANVSQMEIEQCGWRRTIDGELNGWFDWK